MNSKIKLVMNMNDEKLHKAGKFDFTPYANAIRQARKKAGLTIEELAECTGVSSRYISAIENEGKKTSIQTLMEIITFLHISIDGIIYPENPNKDSDRLKLESMLDELDQDSIKVTTSVVKALVDVKSKKEN